jgi:hypothetical protein
MDQEGQRRVASLVLGVLVGSMVAILMQATPVSAATSCGSFKATGSGPDNTNHFGTKTANLWTDNPTVSTNCYTVRSVYAKLDPDNWVETGWYKDPDGVVFNCRVAANPRSFVYANVNGFIKCSTSQEITTNTYHSWRVENGDHNTVWNYYFDNGTTQTYDTNMTQGYSQALAERHGGTDPNAAEFNGLRWMGSNGGWNSWTSSYVNASINDSPYVYCVYNSQWDHFFVKKNSC